jgi:protein KRI1
LEKEEEEYRTFLQREVGEDLSNLVTVEESKVTAKDAVDADEPKKKRKRGRSRDRKDGLDLSRKRTKSF